MRNQDSNSQLSLTVFKKHCFSNNLIGQQLLYNYLKRIQKSLWKTCWTWYHLWHFHLLRKHAQKLALNDRLFFLKNLLVFFLGFIFQDQKHKLFHCYLRMLENGSRLTNQDPSLQPHDLLILLMDLAPFPLMKNRALCNQRHTH